MPKETYPVPTSNPHLQLVISFFLTWIVSAVVIALANMLFPDHIVLGTMTISYSAALLLSSGVLAWATTLCIALFTEVEVRQKRVLTPGHWLGGYLVINTIALWSIARLADLLGLGISSWMVVLALAVVLDIAQGVTMMVYGQMQKK